MCRIQNEIKKRNDKMDHIINNKMDNLLTYDSLKNDEI